MPDIGPTLREARMRARIDISEIESETKIRAKYLRALENEEWNLLPGPTYVKTFLRTYAEALGLDAKLLVEEYKLRHERLSDTELARPIGPTRATSGGRGRSPAHPVIPRSYVIAGVVLALCVVVFILSRVGGGSGRRPPSAGAPAPRTTPATATHARAGRRAIAPPLPPARRPAATLVRLQIIATGPVYACLTAKGQPGRLLNGATLMPGGASRTYSSSRFRLHLGNTSAELRVNGHKRPFPKAAVTGNGVFVQITRKGLSALPTAKRPTCTA